MKPHSFIIATHYLLGGQACDVTPRSHLIATLHPPRGQRQVRGVTLHSMITTSPYPQMWAGVGCDTASKYDYIPPTPHVGGHVTRHRSHISLPHPTPHSGRRVT